MALEAVEAEDNHKATSDYIRLPCLIPLQIRMCMSTDGGPCQGYFFLWPCWKQLWSLFNITEAQRVLKAEAETPCVVNSKSVFPFKPEIGVLYLYFFWSHHFCIPAFNVAQLEERTGKCSSTLPCSPGEGSCAFKLPEDGNGLEIWPPNSQNKSVENIHG